MTDHPDRAPDRHPDLHPHGELVDLALGQVAPERRAVLVEHLLACPPCRAEHAELAAGVESVTVAALAVQPPLGFDQRVLARMVGPDGAAPTPVLGGDRGTSVRGSPPRSARGGWPVLAAAAVVVVALVVGAAALAGRGGGGTDERVAALTTSDGRDVGTATVTEVGGEPVLVVGLTEGAEGRAYTCRMRFADGSTVDTEPWSAAPGAGWLVPLPDDRGPLTDIALVAPGGPTWSTADLDA